MSDNILPYVVAGAAKPGIGAAITRRLLESGFHVIGTYEEEDAEGAIALSKEFSQQLEMKSVDHSSQPSLLNFVARLPSKLSGLVYAQFFFAMEDPTNFDYEIWTKSLAVNLTGPNLLSRQLQFRLLENSSIVVITSTEGYIGSFGASAYAATKAAIHNLVKTLANNFGTASIRVNAVAPGWIGGVMDTDEVFNMSRKITPLGRLGRPEEIASVVWFLLSQESSFINGATIVADGGYSGVDTIAKYEFEQSQK